jgi:hypothetical protein
MLRPTVFVAALAAEAASGRVRDLQMERRKAIAWYRRFVAALDSAAERDRSDARVAEALFAAQRRLEALEGVAG